MILPLNLFTRFPVFGFPFLSLVGLHNLLYQPVTNDVLFIELNSTYASDMS